MTENHKMIMQLLQRLDREFSGRPEVVPAVIRIFAEEIGGLRMRFPDIRTLERWERNAKICRDYRRHNIEELALRHRLSSRQILNIAGGDW